MRTRRHQSGNSNMPRPVSAAQAAECGSGSGAAALAVAVATQPQSRPGSSGAMTARARPVALHDDAGASKRRIHSARSERATPLVASAPTARAVLTARDAAAEPPAALPRLQIPALPLAHASADVQWAIKVAEPVASDARRPATSAQRRPSAPSVDTIAAATAGTSVAPVPAHLAPVLREFTALLRDRYEGKRSLRLAFLNWDRDKDGQLSLQEVRDLIHSLGFAKKLGRDSVEAIIGHVASLPKQSLLYDDFCSYVYGTAAGAATTSDAAPSTVAKSEAAGVAAVEPQPQPAAATTAAAAPTSPQLLLSSDRALYPDVDHVVNLLRKKYESRKLRNVFRHWDADKDGCITLGELELNLRRQGVRLPAHQLAELFQTHDLDRDGRLLYHEFVAMIYGPVHNAHHNPALQAHLREVAQQNNQPPDPYQILRNAALDKPAHRIDEEAICAAVQRKLKVFAPRIHDAYTAFDDDHNGYLSYLEFRQGLNELGLHFTEREFVHLAAIVDTDGSGEISFKEFSNMFHRKTVITTADRTGNGGNSSNSVDTATNGAAETDDEELLRRTKIPTRRGRTPVHDTKELISNAHDVSTRFHTETQIYGSGQPPSARARAADNNRSNASGSPATTTLGQEEKQRKDASYAQRLHRIRQQQSAYDQRAEPLRDAYDQTQQRRLETLHRHQQRYNQSIEEHRPAQPQYSPAVAQRARQLTMPPYINSAGPSATAVIAAERTIAHVADAT